MKYQLILALVIFTSCKSIKITDVTKKIVTPGISTGLTKIAYNAKVTVSKRVKINFIAIENKKKTKLGFSIIDLSNGRVLSTNEVLTKGIYYLEIFTPYKNSLAKSEDTLVFTFDSGKTIKKHTVLKEALRMK